MVPMSQKHSRKARKIIRGFRNSEPMFHGTDSLHDKKLKTELAKMILQAHMQEVQQHLPKEEAEEMAYRFMDQDGNEWIERPGG